MRMVSPPWAGLGRLRITPRVPGQPSEPLVSPDNEQRVTLGSAPDCTIRLVDPTVSRYHAELVPGAGGLEIRDLARRSTCAQGPGKHRLET